MTLVVGWHPMPQLPTSCQKVQNYFDSFDE
jgi:hypothetical protein